MPKYILKPSRLDISSNIENVRSVEPFLKKFCTQHKLCKNTYSDMLLVLTEAVTNSIKHGNELDPSKKVTIELQRHNCGKVCFEIKDEGKGFDPMKVPDPTQPNRITQPNGRGLMLMNAIANKVDYTQKGKCCKIEFLRDFENH